LRGGEDEPLRTKVPVEFHFTPERKNQKGPHANGRGR